MPLRASKSKYLLSASGGTIHCEPIHFGSLFDMSLCEFRILVHGGPVIVLIKKKSLKVSKITHHLVK